MKIKQIKYLFLIAFVVVSLIYYCLSCIKGYESVYSFKITKIEINTKTVAEIYDENSEFVDMGNYRLFASDGLEVGDSIYKGSCSKYLYIYRKQGRHYYMFKKIIPKVLIPYEWVCN